MPKGLEAVYLRHAKKRWPQVPESKLKEKLEAIIASIVKKYPPEREGVTFALYGSEIEVEMVKRFGGG